MPPDAPLLWPLLVLLQIVPCTYDIDHYGIMELRSSFAAHSKVRFPPHGSGSDLFTNNQIQNKSPNTCPLNHTPACTSSKDIKDGFQLCRIGSKRRSLSPSGAKSAIQRSRSFASEVCGRCVFC